MSKIAERLLALDEKALHVTARQEALLTPEGWRRYAARWRWGVAGAVVLVVLMAISWLSSPYMLLYLIPVFGLVCFQAGRLKTEHDRLLGRGLFDTLRSPTRVSWLALAVVAVGSLASTAFPAQRASRNPVELQVTCRLDGKDLEVNWNSRSTAGKLLALVYDFGDGTTRVEDLSVESPASSDGHSYTRSGRFRVVVTAVAHGAAATKACIVNVAQ